MARPTVWLVTATGPTGAVVEQSREPSETMAIRVALRHRGAGFRATIWPAIWDDRRKQIERDIRRRRR